eukprot:gene2971-3424_t
MWYYFSMTSLVILMILSIIGQTLVILSAIINKKLRNYTHALIINLAVADLLISIFSLPLRILRLLINHNLVNETVATTQVFCKVTTCTTIVLFASSNYFLLLMTFDRYFAVKHPFYYKLNFRKGRMIGLIVTAWLVAATVATLPLYVNDVQRSGSDEGCTYASVMQPGYTIFIEVVTYFAPSFVMFALYAIIIRKVRKTLSGTSKYANRTLRSNQTEKFIRKKERKMSMGILFLLVAHTVCNAPICILDLVQIITNVNVPAVALEVCLLLSYANQVVNAPTYAAANREYYNTFKELIYGCFAKVKSGCKACLKSPFLRLPETKSFDLIAQSTRINRTHDNAWYIRKVIDL